MLRVFYVLLFLSDFKSARYVTRIRQNTFIEPIDIIKVQVQYNVRDKSKMAETEIVTDPLAEPRWRAIITGRLFTLLAVSEHACAMCNYTHWIILTGKYMIFKKTLDKVKVNLTVFFTSSCNTPTSTIGNAIDSIETMCLNVEPLWKADIKINLTHL